MNARALVLLVLVLSAFAAAPAAAAPLSLGGSPLAVYVDGQGQLQAFRDGGSTGIFFPPSDQTGDAGFFLAFPSAGNPVSVAGDVYGFDGSIAGPIVEGFTPLSPSPVSGAGTAGDPLTQVTTYAVYPAATDLVKVVQTTTYVNGAQQFTVRWDVTNVSGTSLSLKGIAAADFFFDGSDRGTGIYTDGPPRFIGGTNADTGNSGGFQELLGAPFNSPPWTSYQALAWGGGPDQVWGKVEAAATASPVFDSTVVGEPVDNAGGVEWDMTKAPLANNATTTFALVVRNAVPSALQMNPTNAATAQGVPVTVNATALDTNGAPYAGRTLRYTITGSNATTGALTLDASGVAGIVDPAANAGNDTVVAFVDFNNNGVREPVEPQASALVTVVDKVPPKCKVSVSGDRPGGGGAGKPLVITVNCGESATVTVATSLVVAAGKASARHRGKHKRRKPTTIKLKPQTQVATAGKALAIKVAIPRRVARKYAGRRLTAKTTVRAKDSAGNVSTVKKSRTIQLAQIKHKHRRHRR